MMTVRFPDGTSVQYNTACFVSYGDHYHQLRDRQDGTLIAIVPSSAIVELVTACRVYNSVQNKALDRMIAVESELRNLKRNLAKVLKGKQ